MSFLRTADKPISREPEGSYCRGTLQRGNLRSRFLPAAPVALHGTSGGLKGPALNLSEDFETRQRRLAGRCRSRRVLLDLRCRASAEIRSNVDKSAQWRSSSTRTNGFSAVITSTASHISRTM